jgi:uncharacterized protein (DUF927 family)
MDHLDSNPLGETLLSSNTKPDDSGAAMKRKSVAQTVDSLTNPSMPNSRGSISFRPGDLVQWLSQGVFQFSAPQPIRELSPDGEFAFFGSSSTGIPVAQLQVTPSVSDAPPEQSDAADQPQPAEMLLSSKTEQRKKKSVPQIIESTGGFGLGAEGKVVDIDKAPKRKSNPKPPEVSYQGEAGTSKFAVSDRGVFFIDEATEGKVFVCGRLDVLAYTRDAEGQAWGRLLHWQDRDRREHLWPMPMRLLSGERSTYEQILLDGGLRLGTHPQAHVLLKRYLQEANPQGSLLCTPNVGWHGRDFVLPGRTIPETADVIYQNAAAGEHFYRSKGTLEEWTENIARPCRGNSRLVYAVSMAFAGPLVRPLGGEGGGTHFVGLSSLGKSITQRIAGSVCGGGNGAFGFGHTWQATMAGLEGTAWLHNDGLLILEEIGEVIDPSKMDKTLYMLANGGGKIRGAPNTGVQHTATWILLFLSSGEKALNETAEKKVKAGVQIRLLNIPADAGAGMGVFENLHNETSAKAFAEKLRKLATSEYYGTALPAFLRYLTAEWDRWISQAGHHMDRFLQQHHDAKASTEVGRVLQRFAIIAAAGEVATEMGITGWSPGEAYSAASRCFRDWIQDRGGTGQADVECAIDRLRQLLQSDANRFQSVTPVYNVHTSDEIKERIPHRAGFYKEIGDERRYLVFPQIFLDEVCAGSKPLVPLVAATLHRRNVLEKGDGKNWAKRECLPDGNPHGTRVYCVSARILKEDDPDSQVTDRKPQGEPVADHATDMRPVSPPAVPCSTCGGVQFWRETSSAWQCYTCTSPPKPHDMFVQQWWRLDLRDDTELSR